MHKGGGTTINSLFHNLRKYPRNRNGNPWSMKVREIIKFWDYDKEELDLFLEDWVNSVKF